MCIFDRFAAGSGNCATRCLVKRGGFVAISPDMTLRHGLRLTVVSAKLVWVWRTARFLHRGPK